MERKLLNNRRRQNKYFYWLKDSFLGFHPLLKNEGFWMIIIGGIVAGVVGVVTDANVVVVVDVGEVATETSWNLFLFCWLKNGINPELTEICGKPEPDIEAWTPGVWMFINPLPEFCEKNPFEWILSFSSLLINDFSLFSCKLWILLK